MQSKGLFGLLFNIFAFAILISSVRSIVGLSLLELSAEEKTLFEPPFEDIVRGRLYNKLRVLQH